MVTKLGLKRFKRPLKKLKRVFEVKKKKYFKGL